MEVIRFMIAGAILFCSFSSAQEPARLKVVNLIDTGQPTTLSLNGYTFKQGNPMAPGHTTGAVKLPPGPHSVTFENPGADRKKMNVSLDLKAGTSYGLICFSEIELKKDAEGNEVEVYRMKNTLLSGNDRTDKAKLTVFALTKAQTVELRIKGRPYRLAQKQPVNVDVKVGEIIEVADTKNNPVGEIEIISAFHYVGFVDDKSSDGKLRLTFYEQRSYSGEPMEISEGDSDELTTKE